ncbi:MAG: T9SS C-terminal target domain-containing protein [Calditrichaeota bacterium]|nr:MAG: T9SS C-terminal target domain-containing protein [Calditrichota bacterium]
MISHLKMSPYFLMIFLNVVLYALGDKPEETVISVVQTDTIRLAVNRIDLSLFNDGGIGTDGNGFYPTGTMKPFLFDGGMAFTGVIDGDRRASWLIKTRLYDEWQPGKFGTDSTDPLYHFYSISVNDPPGGDRYQDWMDAVALGADFIDNNGDGLYDPDVDAPPLMGDQLIWNVINDGVWPNRLLGTPPLELEIEQTIWAYTDREALGDVIFFLYKLRNTSSQMIDSLYFSIWADPDLGEYDDDLMGCDTLRQLGYVYNDEDDIYYGNNPPAFGIKLLQGPVVDSPGDSAFVFKGRVGGIDTLLNRRLLFLSSFSPTVFNHPEWGGPQNALEAHRRQMGLSLSGDSLDPTQWGTGGTSTDNPLFLFSGNPVTPSGWVDNDPGDKSFLMNTGPFQLGSGEIQYLAFAYILGRWVDPISSILKMRENAETVMQFFPNQRFLRIWVNEDTISTDSTFLFNVVYKQVVGEDSIQSVEWLLLARPPGSNADILPGPDFQASLDPDEPGLYLVELHANFFSGIVMSDTIHLIAYDNHPPQVSLTLSPQEIFWGGSLVADASGSFDPDNDPISFEWESQPWVLIQSPHSSVTNLTPLHVGQGEVTVRVRDNYFTAEKTRFFYTFAHMNGFIQEKYSGFLNQTTQLSYENGKIFALVPNSKIVFFDPYMSPIEFNSENISAVKMAVLDTFLIAYGTADSIEIYTIQDTSLFFRSQIPGTIIQRNQNYADVYIVYPHLMIPVDFPPRLEVFDISDPGNPTLVASHPLPHLTNDMVFTENLAFLNSRIPAVGLVSLDISNPFAIHPLDSLPLPQAGFYNIEAHHNLVYILNDLNEGDVLGIVDASNPQELIYLNELQIVPPIQGEFENPILNFKPVGDTLLLGLKYGIALFDMTNPMVPEEIASRFAGSPVKGIEMNHSDIFEVERGDTSFGAGYYQLKYDSTIMGGADLIPYSPPIEFELSQNYPNPFNAETNIQITIPIASRVQLVVYDVLGRKIKTLLNKKLPAGRFQVKWDATNQQNQPITSGIYFYQLKVFKNTDSASPDLVKTGKLVLLK